MVLCWRYGNVVVRASSTIVTSNGTVDVLAGMFGCYLDAVRYLFAVEGPIRAVAKVWGLLRHVVITGFFYDAVGCRLVLFPRPL